MTRITVSKLRSELMERGWVKKQRRGKQIIVKPDTPVALQRQMIDELLRRMEVSQFKGEFICRAILDYVIGPLEYVDNARPSFLVNPLTGERLEYDRYYPLYELAVEFNGPQHYSPTKAFSDPEQVKETRARDLIKRGLSSEFNITLVTITLEDLSVEGVLSKLPDRIPKAEIDPGSLYAQSLDRLASEYVSSAKAFLTRKAPR